MGTHGSGKRLPPPPISPFARSIPPEPEPKAPDALHTAARAIDGVAVVTAAATLLDVLHRMPWCRDHRPECPASSAGPCTCGSEALGAAIGALGDLLHP